ncbi:MAG TPA: Ku protein, partial [Candidatus Saccharimonadales bacterium]|nr:Ku protein [Candidatus Saccharimonadales bacterium]
IEIEQFVTRDPDDAATRFVEKAYYIEPDPIGRKAFALLKEVLAEQGLTAICKVVIKDREALAAIDPFGPAMLLSTLHWPDEIRDIRELDLPTEEPAFKPAERRMAEQLVAAMTGEFSPSEYHDEYREALMKVIESKVEGKQTFTPQPAETGGNLVDLMAALEASVAATRRARDAAAGGRPVSVKEARARSATRSPSEAADRVAPKTRATASKPAATHEEVEQARPPRRRKSA